VVAEVVQVIQDVVVEQLLQELEELAAVEEVVGHLQIQHLEIQLVEKQEQPTLEVVVEELEELVRLEAVVVVMVVLV